MLFRIKDKGSEPEAQLLRDIMISARMRAKRSKNKYEVVSSDRYILRYKELYRLFAFTVYLRFICSYTHGLHNHDNCGK
jgi:hypothetical protein